MANQMRMFKAKVLYLSLMVSFAFTVHNAYMQMATGRQSVVVSMGIFSFS